jgi:DNA-binding CsgD family transcriptional regulator
VTNQLSESDISHRRGQQPGALATAGVGGVDAYEATWAAMFSNLFRPVEFGRHTAVSGAGPIDSHEADPGPGPEGTFLLAAGALGARRMAQAARLLRRLDVMTAGRADRWQWTAREEFLWAVYAEQISDIPGVLEHAAASVQIIEQASGSGPDPHGPPGSRGCLSTIDAVISEQLPLMAARAHIALGETTEAEARLVERYGPLADAECSQPATLALLACQQGRLSAALRLATGALNAAERQDTAADLVDLEARLVLSQVFFERNQLDASWRQLETGLRLCWLTGATQWMWPIEIDLARVQLARGEAGQALHRLEHLRVKGAGFLAQPTLRRLNQVAVECQLQLGDLEGALEGARSTLPAEIPSETLARIDLACGRPDRVAARLGTSPSPDLATQIRRLLLLAGAERQQGRTRRAFDITRWALDAAQPERYIRPFLEQPGQTLPLLRGLEDSFSNPYLVGLIGEAERLAPPAGPAEPQMVLEPLTEREREVLRFLPSHLNLRQIGLLMCVSTNTVKTHVKAIYRKTGAISRDDAVTIARALGLL